MDPQQPTAPDSGNNYDFILNPQTPPASKPVVGVVKNPFVMRLIVIIVGAGLLMVVVAIVVNLLFGSKTNLDDIVSITQTQQEIARLSGQGNLAGDQRVKNAAINTQLSLKSQQRVWLAFLAKSGRTVKPEELVIKKDAVADKKLVAATKTSTFDSTYTPIMRTGLQDYAKLLKDAYSRATGEQQRALLNSHYAEVQLLLKQWPES